VIRELYVICVLRHSVAKGDGNPSLSSAITYHIWQSCSESAPAFWLSILTNSQLRDHCDFKEAMSIENRYFTSDFSNLSYASLTV
jgi:hypothetical protein